MKSSALAIFLLSGLAIVSPDRARAIEVYRGCAQPREISNPQNFYVDPIKGSKANDGSMERPWRTLAEVLDPAGRLISTKALLKSSPTAEFILSNVNPNGPVKPGAILHLMSGNHGTPQVRQYVNDDFISVVAAPGQTPVLDALSISGSSRWLFRGLKFQGARGPDKRYNYLVDVGQNTSLGPSENIIFAENSFSTQDQVAGWTAEDWTNKPFSKGLQTFASCTTLYKNRFYNLLDGIGLTGSKMLIDANVIEDFGNDGIDHVASDVVIRRNVIKNGILNAGGRLHPDGIQGWTAKGVVNTNVTIDSNTIIQTGDYKISSLQGITIFDGKWDGLNVVNNVVVTNHWHGITLLGVKNAVVVNNTVVPSGPLTTWIKIANAKDQTPSSNVVVRNNVSSQLHVVGEAVSMDHNIVQNMIAIFEGGAPKFYKKGVVGNHNMIDPSIYGGLTRVDHAAGLYDLRPRADSRLIGAGASDGAPPFDIAGKPRKALIDIGAYAR